MWGCPWRVRGPYPFLPEGVTPTLGVEVVSVLMAEAQQGQGPLLHIHRIGVVVQIQRDFSAGELHVQPLADCLEAVGR